MLDLEAFLNTCGARTRDMKPISSPSLCTSGQEQLPDTCFEDGRSQIFPRNLLLSVVLLKECIQTSDIGNGN